MTLMELMVALAILGLCTGLIFSNLGPWFSQSRRARDDAQFWRDTTSTELSLSELTLATIDPGSATIGAHEARLRVYLRRLSPLPVAVELKIETSNSGFRLALRSPALPSASILLDGAPPLRFGREADALVLEGQSHGQWRPVAVGPFGANAPLACSFDPIARSCR